MIGAAQISPEKCKSFFITTFGRDVWVVSKVLPKKNCRSLCLLQTQYDPLKTLKFSFKHVLYHKNELGNAKQSILGNLVFNNAGKRIVLFQWRQKWRRLKGFLRWLETVSITFEDVEFNGSDHGIKKHRNHWFTCCCQFCGTRGYHSNKMTCYMHRLF